MQEKPELVSWALSTVEDSKKRNWIEQFSVLPLESQKKVVDTVLEIAQSPCIASTSGYVEEVVEESGVVQEAQAPAV